MRKPEDNIYKKLVPLKRDTDDEDQIIEEIIYVVRSFSLILADH